MMDWSKVASNIGSSAPLLAGLVGGPIGVGVTAAAAIISHALGTPSDPGVVELALNDPTALEKVRQAESANSLQLQQLMVSAAQASLAHESDMARIQAADRADARAMGISNKDWVPKVLAMAVTAGFFGILLLMAFQPLPGANKDLVNVIVGALGTAWISIIGYYFGTSVPSRFASPQRLRRRAHQRRRLLRIARYSSHSRRVDRVRFSPEVDGRAMQTRRCTRRAHRLAACSVTRSSPQRT
jgi:hypothetical protein